MALFLTSRFLRAALLPLALASGLAANLQAEQLVPVAQSSRIAAQPNLGPQTQLSGHVPVWAQASSQVASRPVDLSTTLNVSLVLQRDPAVQAAFTKFLADQQTPGSPLYHQWLTPDQVGTLFGPTTSDLAAVTSWLTAQGLTVASISPSRMFINVTGTASAIGAAFRTSFAYFSVNGTPRLSATTEPFVPTAFTPVIAGIHGLADELLQPNSIRSTPHAPTSPTDHPALTVTSNNVNYYLTTPADFATIYDINSVYTGGNTGATIGSKAQHVAIVGRSRVAPTDISEYATNVGLGSYTYGTIIPTGGVDPGTTNTGDQDEATLDVDRVIGTAPGATVDLIVATNASGGIFLDASYNVNTLVDKVMTISFGACEINAGFSNVNAWDTLFSTGAAEGISTFVSSGDSGADGCASSFTTPTQAYNASINSICSSTYATCVGGTEFNDTASPSTYWSTTNGTGGLSAKSYIPEGGWNEPTSVSNNVTTYEPAASGGGVSTYISKPTWQTVTGVPTGTFRFAPDVAFLASSHDGFYACLDYALVGNAPTGASCASSGGGYFFDFSGTSAAAPSMAGIAALLNTKLGTAQGNLNPLLYKLSATSPTAFHDVTVATSGVTNCVITTPSMCNNSTPGATANSTTATGGVQGYLVTTGYDEVTGLGSLDVANFLTAAAASPTTSTTLALTTVTPNPAVINQTVTLTATLTRSATTAGAATGSVIFYNNGTIIGSPISISNNVATTTTTFPAVGTYSITATYSGDLNYLTSTAPGVFLSVVTGPTFSLTPSTTSGTVTAGATSTADSIAVTSLNSFVGTVALTCAVSPSTDGTCAVTPTAVTLTSGGLQTTSLTVTPIAGYSGTLTAVVTGTSGTTAVPSAAITYTVNAPSFNFTQPTALSFTGGATQGNTATTTLSPTLGFTGSVSLSCAISLYSGSPTSPASCAVSPTTVTVSSNSSPTATITISSIVAHARATQEKASLGSGNWGIRGGLALATLLCLIPFRRRRLPRSLALMALLAIGLASFSGCSNSSSTAAPTVQTSAGIYSVTVTGSGDTTNSTLPATNSVTFTVTVN